SLRLVLIGLAREHTDTILPGYSFGAHAQPMTLAHLWLSWAATLARDFERLHGCYTRVNVSPAGASLETPAVIAVLYHSPAKWADDLIQWSTTEFGFVDMPDRYCNTSSIMMQKKNVIGPAQVKGASAEALGCFVTSYHALKGTTGLPITERYYALEMLWKVADSAAR